MPRENTPKRIVTFFTTTDAMAFERFFLDRGLPGRLIPLPEEISAGCGMCWMVRLEDAAELDLALAAEDLPVRVEGVHEIVF